MQKFSPELLANWTGGRWNYIPTGDLSGFCIDSRKATSGDIFVCIPAKRNGHDFLEYAKISGAKAALVDHYVVDVNLPQLLVTDTTRAFQQIARMHRDNFTGSVIGITGSCGKTSTKELLGSLLNNVLTTEGNLNNFLGVPLTITKVFSETHQYAVVEAGINQIDEMDILTDMICPEIVIITSIGEAHLDGLKSSEKIAEEKIKLWTKTPRDCLGIFPDEFLEYQCFIDASKNKRHLRLFQGKPGLNDLAEDRAFYSYSTETNRCGHSSTLSLWRYECPPLVLNIPRVSKGVARNFALSCLAAWKLGAADKDICERLPQYQPSVLRGNRLAGRGCEYLIDCYNANPLSMKDSVDFFAGQFEGTKKLYVLAGMNELGPNSAYLHRETGSKIRLEKMDRVILIGEKATDMADGILQNGAREDQIVCLNNSNDARAIVEDFEGAVLFKGSRAYRLEDLIPKWAVEETPRIEVVAC